MKVRNKRKVYKGQMSNKNMPKQDAGIRKQGKNKTKGKKVKKKPLPIEVTRDEYVKLLYATKYMRHKVGFMLAFESGLRISEVVNLKKEDFDFANKTVRVNMGKNSKDRIVSLPLSWQVHHINYIPTKCK